MLTILCRLAISTSCRLLQRLFEHIECPLATLVSAQQQQQQPDTAAAEAQELLALAALRALQLNSSLGLTWRGALWFKLLNHSLPLVRWVAVRGVVLLLGLSDAVQQQLMAQQLDEQQLVAAQMR
jgi:hypothetical protein